MNEEVLLKMIEIGEIQLEEISEYGKKKYPSIFLQVVKKDGILLQYVPEDKLTEKICLEAVKQNGFALQYVPKDKLTEKICIEAVKQNGYALQYVPEDKLTEKICIEAVKQKGNVLQRVPEDKRTEEIYLEAVKRDGTVLQYVPEDKRTEEICLEAVKQNGSALEYVPEDQKTEEVCLEAVKQNGFALEYVPEDKITEEVCLEAVKQNGYALLYLSEDQKTEEICREAVKQNKEAVKLVPEDKIEMFLPEILMFSDLKEECFNLLPSDILSNKEVLESYGIEASPILEEAIKNNIVRYSIDYSNDNFMEYLTKMVGSIGEQETVKMLTLPTELKEEVLAKSNNIDKVLEESYDVKYMLKGDIDLVVEMFRKLDVGKGKEKLEVYKQINQMLEGDSKLTLNQLLDVNTQIPEEKADKNIALINQINRKLTHQKIKGIEGDLVQKIDESFTLQKQYVNQIIQTTLTEQLNQNNGVLGKDYLEKIEKEITERKKSNGSLYYSPHVVELKEKIKEFAQNYIEKNEKILNRTNVDILRETKEKIGKGWIRKCMNVSHELSAEEYQKLSSELGIDIESEKVYNLKEGVNLEEVYQTLSRIGYADIFDFRKMETMFSGIREPYDEKTTAYCKKYMNEIKEDVELAQNFSRLYNSYPNLSNKPGVRAKLDQGLADPKYMLEVLDQQKYDNYKYENFAKEAKENKVDQNEYEIAEAIYEKAKNKIGSTIPPISERNEKYRGRMLRADEPLVVLAGNATNCCQKVGDVGESSMIHGALEKNGGIFVVEKIDEDTGKGMIIAQSWTWRNKERMCFDNIEVPSEILKNMTDEEQEKILEVYQKAGEKAIITDQKMLGKLVKEGSLPQAAYDQLVLKEVTAGLGYNDLEILEKKYNKNVLEHASIVAPKEQEIEYQEGMLKTAAWIDSKTRQAILARMDKTKLQEIEKRQGEKVNKSRYEIEDLSRIYTNERLVEEKQGEDVTEEDIERIKKIEKEVYREEQQVINKGDCETIDDLVESYEMEKEKTKIVISKDNDWYLIMEEKEQELYIADLAMVGGVNAQKNGEEIKSEAKIATFEIAEKIYEEFIQMAEKEKVVITNATRDTSYLNIKKMEEKGLVEISSDENRNFGGDDGSIEMNDVVLIPNKEKLEEELAKIKQMLTIINERRRVHGIANKQIEGESR